MAVSGGDGSIILKTKVDTSGLNSGLNSIKTSIGKIGAAIGVSLGVNALVQFGRQAMNLASDLQEVQNVVDVAFGDMAYKMEQFADTAIETYGISKLTAKQIGSTFMSMAVGMGIADGAASDMSLTLTGLAADVASFRNVTVEEARTALSAVFTGETETLKRYGVVMTELNLQEYARSQGIEKSISAMTQQEKVMLRYGFVMEYLGLAQGDFARTQDSFANKTRVLTEKWKEMQSVFGETLIILADGLMPILEVVIQKLTIFALYLAAFAKGMTSAKEETDELAQNTQNYGKNANTATNKTKTATNAIKALGTETKKTNKQLAQFDELMVLQSAGSNAMDEAGIGGIGDIFPSGFSENMGALNEFLDGDTLQNIQEFQTWVSENKGAIKTALEVAGILALAGSVASLLKKLGLLPGAFKKKDDGLDTQTPKVQTETAAVNALSAAFSVAAVAILSKFVPALDELFGKQEETSSATATATQEIEKQQATMTSASEIAAFYGLATSDASSEQEKLGKSTLQTNRAIEAQSNILQNSQDKNKTYSESVAGMVDDVRGFVGASQDYVEATNAMGKSTENAMSYVSEELPQFLSGTESAISEWATSVATMISNPFSVAAVNIGISLSNMFENIKNFFKQSKKLETDENSVFAIREATGYKALESKKGLSNFWSKISNVGRFASFSIAGALSGGFAIPAFARGAVLPGGKPFLGILNDQPAGQTNIEAPLQTIVDAFNIALSQNGGSRGNTEVVLEIDGREFGRAVVEQGDRENRRIGTRLVIA